MAITGTGTEQDPWIVHSYTELKYVYDNVQDTTPRFAKLANDINCNDYGADFEWETISVTWSNRNIDLDLNGKAIKNVKVKTGNNFFKGNSFCKIHDGKILNVFLSNAKQLTDTMDGANSATFKNVSFSVNATGNTAEVFYYVVLDSCSVYGENLKQHGSFFRNVTATNSDFKVKIADQNYSLVFTDCAFTGCRFKECGVGGACPNVNIYPYGDVRIFTYGQSFANCVVDIDFTGVTIAPTDGNVFRGFDTASQTTVINKSKWIPNLTPPASWQFCTDSEIKSGSYLNGSGFVVYQTTPATA